MALLVRRGAAALVLLLGLAARADLFSPGDLARPHATLEGLSNCTQCHPAGEQLSQGTCLRCHQELEPRLQRNAGLHGRLAAGEARNCEHCHHEHQGSQATLIDWGKGGESGFDHLRAGWPLLGRHRETKCATCHEKRLVRATPVRSLLEHRPRTLLGLGTDCVDCHFDEHRGQTRDGCEHCHDEKAWQPAPGFDHDQTEYALRGKHLKVKCSGCHDAEKDPEAHGFPAPRSETFLRFAPVEHRTCLDCHKDPHAGRFGPRCQSCHVVEGWSLLRNATQERAFHEKTRFPLTGAHLDVDCKACHGPWPGQKAKFKGLAFETCGACHADAHEGQLGPGADGRVPDCKACHGDQSFSPARFGLSEHVRTAYPLEGAHQAVPCASCHPPTPQLKARIPRPVLADLKRRRREEHFSVARFDFAKPTAACESCHADPHAGQFSRRPCTQCHQVSSFSTLTFDHRADTRFPLEGAHARVTCAQCHVAPRPDAPIVYTPLPTTCAGCHADAHAGQLTGGGRRCETCHQVDAWKTLRFEHAPPFTDFRLDGQHARARCEACHRPVQVATGVSTVQYRPLPTRCEGCHADFHRGAFQGFEP